MVADISSVCLYGVMCIVVGPYDTVPGLDQSQVEPSGAAEKRVYCHIKISRKFLKEYYSKLEAMFATAFLAVAKASVRL